MNNTWYDDTVYSEFKGKNDLINDLKCDVLIVGGGLAGLSLLYNLKKNNVDAVLIEEKQIGSGASGSPYSMGGPVLILDIGGND